MTRRGPKRDPDRTRHRVIVGFFALLVVFSVVDHYILGIARSNLTSAGFDREHEHTPRDFGIPYSNVTIDSDGLPLAAWWMAGPPGANALSTIVLVHGYSADMSKPVAHWAPNLHALGYNLLALDLRNHGASADGRNGFVTYGVDEARDIEAAVAWLHGNAAFLGIDADRIVLYGESMGAASALNAAAANPAGIRGVIADSAYANFRFQADLDGAKKHYPGFLVDWVVSDMDALAPSPPTASHPDKALAALTIPVLLAHCSNDTRIDPASFHALEARAHSPTTWFEECTRGESGDHHGDGWANDGYNATVDAFLTRALGPD